ncbi:transposase [Cesiribacter sp. SM1]|uniref:transposase n=1 Tax=Cesiribacter sp. SM1 TaxID=2861196 RepID=UPI001CD6BDCB
MKKYASDLTDTENKIIKKARSDQRKRKYDLLQIWDAIFYLLKTGCQWHYLSCEYPPYKTVYYYFDKWKKKGVKELHDHLLKEQSINMSKKAHLQ